MASQQLLIYGAGYTAEYIAKASRGLGYRVLGTSRQEARRHELRSMGITPLTLEMNLVKEALYTTTHLLMSYPPPPKDSDDIFRTLHRSLTKKDMPELRWIGYLSSTAVYGDFQGAWVDETAPLTQTSVRGTRRAEAEQCWNEFAKVLGLPCVIFRLSGIYGPYRNALTSLREGLRDIPVKEGHVFSRIHITDIAHIVSLAMEHPTLSTLYNVADDEPAPSHIVYEYAARLLKMTDLRLIPFDNAKISEAMRDFYNYNRRIDNKKLKHELGYRLQFTTFREGLGSLFNEKQF